MLLKSLIKKSFSQSSKNQSNSSSKTHVTFIGLGNMGLKMATNLAKSNKYLVSGFDTNKDFENLFNSNENSLKISFKEAVSSSKYIITMLPNTDIVKSVWEEIHSNQPKKGTYIIDSSTISPIESKAISQQAEKRGYKPSDAPVSGGVMGAKNATLSFMLGTKKEYVPEITDFVSSMGKNIFHCGEYGCGQIVKVCNNLVLGITNAGLSEALVIGETLGMDKKILCNVMSVSTANCFSLNVNCPVPGVLENTPSSRDYENGFNTELMRKDLKLVMEVAKKNGNRISLGEVASDYYSEVMKAGQNKKDFSYVYKYLLDEYNKKKV